MEDERWKEFAGNPHSNSDLIIMNRRDNNNLLESTNRGNVNMNKEIKEKVAGNRDFINMNKEIIARKLKIFSVDKEIKCWRAICRPIAIL